MQHLDYINFEYNNYEVHVYKLCTFLIHKTCINNPEATRSFIYKSWVKKCGCCMENIPEELLFLIEMIEK